MKIPDIGKLYFIPELNIYCIFRWIYCTRCKRDCKVDFYKDSLRKEPFYDYELAETFRFDISGLTFLHVINNAEARRRPFDFVDLDGALVLLTKKRFAGILCRVKLFNPVVITVDNWDRKENKAYETQSDVKVLEGKIESFDNGVVIFKMRNRSIQLDASNIELLRFRLYEFIR